MRGSNFQTTTLIAVAMLLLILFVSAGYMMLIPGPESVEPSHELLTELETNSEQWERSKPVSFRYVVKRSCRCDRLVTIPYIATENRGLRQVRFRTEIEDDDGNFVSTPPNPVWISDILDEIDNAIASPERPIVEVQYDQHYGYPESVSIQWPVLHGDIQYFIRDFEALEYREE